MKSANIKMLLLMRGNAGKEVAGLKKALRKALGKDASAWPASSTICVGGLPECRRNSSR
ncbi:MAG: hypothetical protein HY935_06900 [Nitrosomonadales bacterium]|nr:hypothetical protein [Nitrosomonadales bacterium]